MLTEILSTRRKKHDALYRSRHPDRRRASQRNYNSKNKLVRNLRKRAVRALKSKSAMGHPIKMLGCSAEHLKTWIAFYFQPGMTWKNYGSVWHLDHVLPCASFDLSDPAQQKICFHYTNLQPLFVLDNLKKGCKENIILWQ